MRTGQHDAVTSFITSLSSFFFFSSKKPVCMMM